MHNIIAIDPGKNGAIAMYSIKSDKYFVIRIPQFDEGNDYYIDPSIIDSIYDFYPAVILIEKSQAMPNQGVASTFQYGVNYGQLIGAIHYVNHLLKDKVKIIKIHPKVWKTHLNLDKGKRSSVDYVEDNLIEYSLLPLTNKKLKLTHDRADAICICEYYKKAHKDELIKLKEKTK